VLTSVLMLVLVLVLVLALALKKMLVILWQVAALLAFVVLVFLILWSLVISAPALQPVLQH
jgi:hypothetical protein